MKKIFVGNLAWEASEEVLRPLFEAFGKVVRVNVVVDQFTGRSRGFGFVEMESGDAATAAINELNDKPLLGRNLRVSLAQERAPGERGERGQGGGGGGGSSRGGFGGDRGGQGRGGRDRDFRGGSGGGGNSYSGGGRSQNYRSRDE